MIESPSMSKEYRETYLSRLITDAEKRNRQGRITVVDFGCGQGHAMDALRHRKRLRMIGIDRSLDALKQAMQLKIQNALLINADIRQSPLSECCADAAIAVGAMTFDPEAMLRAIHHTLKPKGECTASFRLFHQVSETSRTYYRNIGSKEKNESLVVNGQKFDVKVMDHASCTNERLRHSGAQCYFQTVDDIGKFIRTLGFEVVQHDPFAYATRQSSKEQIEVFRIRKM